MADNKEINAIKAHLSLTMKEYYRDTDRREIQEMLEEGIIEHSNSEWSSPHSPGGKEGRIVASVRGLP